MKKILSVSQLIVALLFGWFLNDLLIENIPIHQKNTHLFSEVRSDLSDLKKKTQLPAEFSDAAFFNYHFSPKEIAQIFGTKPDIFTTSANGKYFVDVDVFYKADEKDKVIFQFSIVEKETKNKVGEISREYTLK